MKAKLLYFIAEDWFFCSHFLARAEAARDAGFDVVVLAREQRHGDIIRAAGLRLVPLKLESYSINPLRELRLLRRVIEVYRQEEPALLHHVALKPIIYGSLAARRLGLRPVINAPVGMGYVYSSDALKARLLRPLVTTLLRWLLNPRGGIVVFENNDDLRAQVQVGAVRADNAVLVRGAGVDTRRYHPRDEPSGVPVVTLAARMLRDKGVEEFVAAAGALRDAGVAARFWLVGAVDPRNPASISEAALREWNAEGVVEWLGHCDDMVGVLACTHIACLPSYREGLPKSLLEALACGLPVVTTDVPGCRELVEEGVNGLLVPPRDSVRLAEALRLLIEDASLRRQLGARGRLRAVTEFSDEVVTQATLGIYRRAL